MKRFFLLMIVAIVAITACSKVNDIDKRLGVLENIVSDLKAQISAGAVITSVDKTSDGCTFTLSNGQTYTVTNGKDGTDGTDGEAIIADVKIEENFIVLTLKNGETLRISYQNPLSMVTLNIVPDYDDGTVREPNTTEFNGEKSTIFYLDVAVTPAKYAEILSDTERFIHKAVFSPVQTKSDFGNAFTVSPKSVIYAEGAPIPFLEACFELDDDTAALLQNKNTPYTVSYSIEDKDGVHGASTAFVPLNNETHSGWISSDDLTNGGMAIEVGGHKVTVKFDEGAPGIEENVLVTAYAKNGDVIIKSFSSNGKILSFRRDDTGTILGIAPQDNIYNIVLSEVNQDITVTIDYFLNSNSEFTTINGHNVSVVLDASTDILKGINIDNNGRLVIEAESSSGNPVKCVKDGERIAGSKTGTLYKFTISDITEDATITVGYSKYTAMIGFTQGSVTDKATLKINGGEVKAGESTSVLEGTDVEYSAVVDDGYRVYGWYDNNGQKVSDAESFTVSEISSDVAYYAEVKAGYKLTVNTISAGTSTIAANGVSIESGRAYYYDPNTQITLTASPATGCDFVKWCDADGKTLSTENSYSVTLTSSLTITAVFVPQDALSGVFSVSGNKKVRFSKGNLWYGKAGDAGEATFNFEANQYDTTPSSDGARVENHISHFMWCADATNAMVLKYEDGWKKDEAFFAGKNFTVNGYSGWGVLTGGTNGEWAYLLDTRKTIYGKDTDVENRRYAAVKVNGMAGLLIFPDDFSSWPSGAGDEPQTFNTTSSNWNGKEYTVTEFAVLQNNGCVFLPAAGYRNGSNGNANVRNVGLLGFYWSASPNYDSSADDLLFRNIAVLPYNSVTRNWAQSVRLVTESK